MAILSGCDVGFPPVADNREVRFTIQIGHVQRDSTWGEVMMTIDQLAGHLGRPASALLSATPFSAWKVERSVERDLNPLRIDYMFLDLGLDVEADAQDNVSSIFVHFDDDRSFRVRLAGVSGSSTRRQMLGWLGAPSKSGVGMLDPILGDFGAWDRFATPGYAIHLQYQVNDDRLKLVTLMRLDVVP